ncbi:hypothetical protein DPEC_G00173430 [Dallia pectoralis]|uniref:Uncharacterized protein n=1 Tax=Dallia pectoralis TaxID=75939 RepID=A0ACC2GDT9_DALPE|nr:hypothetical protein DPEC_G00173430 [Dallia pectoralis]
MRNMSCSPVQCPSVRFSPELTITHYQSASWREKHSPSLPTLLFASSLTPVGETCSFLTFRLAPVTSEFRKTTTSEFRKTTTSEFRKTTTSEFGKTTTSEFGKTTTSEFGKTTTSEFGKTTTSEFGKTTTSEFGKTTTSEFGKTTTSEFGKTTTSDFGKTTTSEFRKTTISEFRKTTTSEFRKTTTSEFRKMTTSALFRPGDSAHDGTLPHDAIGECIHVRLSEHGVIGPIGRVIEIRKTRKYTTENHGGSAVTTKVQAGDKRRDGRRNRGWGGTDIRNGVPTAAGKAIPPFQSLGRPAGQRASGIRPEQSGQKPPRQRRAFEPRAAPPARFAGITGVALATASARFPAPH